MLTLTKVYLQEKLYLWFIVSWDLHPSALRPPPQRGILRWVASGKQAAGLAWLDGTRMTRVWCWVWDPGV